MSAAVDFSPPSNAMASDFIMSALNHSSRKTATTVQPEDTSLSTMVEYADRLRAAMEKAGVTPLDLQKHLKVTYQAIKKVLDGKTKALTAENHARAARYLKVNAFWLATGEERMAPAPANEEAAQSSALLATDSDLIIRRTPSQPQPKWPFESIAPADYIQLSERQKGLVEGYTKRLIEESRINKSPAASGKVA